MSSGLAIYTTVHVVISLIGIFTGVLVLLGFLGNKRLDRWTAAFLATTVLTSATGFGFPFERVLPSHIVGVLSLAILSLAIYALYARRMAGAWRKTYVITAMAALYLNVFVAVVQAFLKIPALHELAPTQEEMPFKAAQLVVLGLFIALTVLAVRKFHPGAEAHGFSARTGSHPA